MKLVNVAPDASPPPRLLLGSSSAPPLDGSIFTRERWRHQMRVQTCCFQRDEGKRDSSSDLLFCSCFSHFKKLNDPLLLLFLPDEEASAFCPSSSPRCCLLCLWTRKSWAEVDQKNLTSVVAPRSGLHFVPIKPKTCRFLYSGPWYQTAEAWLWTGPQRPDSETGTGPPRPDSETVQSWLRSRAVMFVYHTVNLYRKLNKALCFWFYTSAAKLVFISSVCLIIKYIKNTFYFLHTGQSLKKAD